MTETFPSLPVTARARVTQNVLAASALVMDRPPALSLFSYCFPVGKLTYFVTLTSKEAEKGKLRNLKRESTLTYVTIRVKTVLFRPSINNSYGSHGDRQCTTINVETVSVCAV